MFLNPVLNFLVNYSCSSNWFENFLVNDSCSLKYLERNIVNYSSFGSCPKSGTLVLSYLESFRKSLLFWQSQLMWYRNLLNFFAPLEVIIMGFTLWSLIKNIACTRKLQLWDSFVLHHTKKWRSFSHFESPWKKKFMSFLEIL
jgi:hypothetical protein